jgi:hypothetical protein
MKKDRCCLLKWLSSSHREEKRPILLARWEEGKDLESSLLLEVVKQYCTAVAKFPAASITKATSSSLTARTLSERINLSLPTGAQITPRLI